MSGRWPHALGSPATGRRPAVCLHRLIVMVAVGAGFGVSLEPARAAQVQIAAFACESGPYAAVLPRHYPTLHMIGRHQATDLDVRASPAGTTTVRRIEYIGMTAEVLLSSREPNAYRLVSLDVSSRRWHVGPLSVGNNPWRTVNDPGLNGVSQDGTHELVGPRDSATLRVRAGRIDRVSYTCAPPGRR